MKPSGEYWEPVFYNGKWKMENGKWKIEIYLYNLFFIRRMFWAICYSKTDTVGSLSVAPTNNQPQLSDIKSLTPIKNFPKLNGKTIKQLVTDQLQNIEYKDTKPFYHNFTYCKCIKVYDGDTITVCTQINHNTVLPQVYRVSVRLFGIDAPEIKGGGATEKAFALKTRDQLREKILGKIVRLEILEEPEKWGRILARVYLDDEDICQWLLDNNLAVSYFGKTKVKAPEWLE